VWHFVAATRELGVLLQVGSARVALQHPLAVQAHRLVGQLVVLVDAEQLPHRRRLGHVELEILALQLLQCSTGRRPLVHLDLSHDSLNDSLNID
jgi:hypothetical protein